MRALILTSPTTSKDISQSSIFYLANFLSKKGMEVGIEDLSGTINFFDPPVEIFKNQAVLWQSGFIFDEAWIDNYIPKCKERYDFIYASALFSMDIVLQGRYAKRCKEINPEIKTMVGGPAVRRLNANQLKAVSSVFDKIFTGFLSVQPCYNLDSYRLKEFVTVATGTGCNWGKCRFCVSGKEEYILKDLNKITKEFLHIAKMADCEVMLSSDSMSISKINALSLKLYSEKNTQKYNLMMRADEKVTAIFSRNLKGSGCTDVFIGGEILDDRGLLLINKGTTVINIINTVKNLNSFGINVQLGLILFLPGISKNQLENQLKNLEEVLPYVSEIELESLSVLDGSYFHENHSAYGIELYPRKNPIFPAWCYGLSPDIPWGFRNDNDYFIWEEHINALRQMIDSYVDKEYWWHIDYIKENWK